jgi:hypothetical protein
MVWDAFILIYFGLQISRLAGSTTACASGPAEKVKYYEELIPTSIIIVIILGIASVRTILIISSLGSYRVGPGYFTLLQFFVGGGTMMISSIRIPNHNLPGKTFFLGFSRALSGMIASDNLIFASDYSDLKFDSTDFS